MENFKTKWQTRDIVQYVQNSLCSKVFGNNKNFNKHVSTGTTNIFRGLSNIKYFAHTGNYRCVTNEQLTYYTQTYRRSILYNAGKKF